MNTYSYENVTWLWITEPDTPSRGALVECIGTGEATVVARVKYNSFKGLWEGLVFAPLGAKASFTELDPAEVMCECVYARLRAHGFDYKPRHEQFFEFCNHQEALKEIRGE